MMPTGTITTSRLIFDYLNDLFVKHEYIFVETGRGLTHKSNLLVNGVFVIDIFIC